MKMISHICLLVTGLFLADISGAQDCPTLAENDYCVDGILCHAESPFPIWQGSIGLGQYFINGKPDDGGKKIGIRIYLKSRPKKTMELTTEVETDEVKSSGQVCIEMISGSKKLYSTGDQKVFCLVNEDGSVTLTADKLAMAKGRGRNAEVVSYLRFKMHK